MNTNLAKIGGVSSLIQSLFYPLAIVAFFLTPLPQLRGGAEFYYSYAHNPWPLLAASASLSILAFLGLTSVAPATASLLAGQRDGWLTVGKNTASFCLAVILGYYTWLMVVLPERARLLSDIGAAAAPGLAASDPSLPLSWTGWFLFGGMGLWVGIVGAVARLSKTMPKIFLLACVLKAGGFFAALAGLILGHNPTLAIGVTVGGLIGAPWYHYLLGRRLILASQAPAEN